MNPSEKYNYLPCDVTPDCLQCPLAQCKHDNPTEYLLLKRQRKDGEVLGVIAKENLSAVQAAQRFGLTERTIFRIKSR